MSNILKDALVRHEQVVFDLFDTIRSSRVFKSTRLVFSQLAVLGRCVSRASTALICHLLGEFLAVTEVVDDASQQISLRLIEQAVKNVDSRLV